MFYGPFGRGRFPECGWRLKDWGDEAGTGFARSAHAGRAHNDDQQDSATARQGRDPHEGVARSASTSRAAASRRRALRGGVRARLLPRVRVALPHFASGPFRGEFDQVDMHFGNPTFRCGFVPHIPNEKDFTIGKTMNTLETCPHKLLPEFPFPAHLTLVIQAEDRGKMNILWAIRTNYYAPTVRQAYAAVKPIEILRGNFPPPYLASLSVHPHDKRVTADAVVIARVGNGPSQHESPIGIGIESERFDLGIFPRPSHGAVFPVNGGPSALCTCRVLGISRNQNFRLGRILQPSQGASRGLRTNQPTLLALVRETGNVTVGRSACVSRCVTVAVRRRR